MDGIHPRFKHTLEDRTGIIAVEATRPDTMYGNGMYDGRYNLNPVTNQNLIIPAGTAKMGTTEYNVKLNSSPDLITAFNDPAMPYHPLPDPKYVPAFRVYDHLSRRAEWGVAAADEIDEP